MIVEFIIVKEISLKKHFEICQQKINATGFFEFLK